MAAKMYVRIDMLKGGLWRWRAWFENGPQVDSSMDFTSEDEAREQAYEFCRLAGCPHKVNAGFYDARRYERPKTNTT